jgi:branched-chain amino acid transport system substrate-binding protein
MRCFWWIKKAVSARRLGRGALLMLAIFSAYASQTFADDKLKVGVSLPLSGVIAECGEAIRNGINLAVSANPDSFKSIDFIFEDNQYDSKRAISAYHKLRETDRVNLIFNWGEAPTLAVAPIAERDKFPLVALSTDPNPLKNFKYTVRFINSQSEYAEKLVTHLRKQGIKRIGIVMTDDPYYVSYLAAIKSYLHLDESLYLIQSYLPGDMDFKSAILKAKAQKYDAIGIFLFIGQISSFYRQAAILNYRPRTFGGDDFDSRSEALASKGGMSNSVYAANKISNDFATRYRERFKDDAYLTYAANSYDFANMIPKLLPLKTSQAELEIIDQLSEIKLPDGALGRAEFVKSADNGSYFRFPVVINKIVKAGVEVIEE